jgi:hypothetical protein
MSRKELYENKLQMDYFSEDYIRFEEDFQKYSAMDVPLTFLIDDILRTMAMNQKNYFKLNKENSKDGRDHFFYFKIEMSDESKMVRKYQYLQVFSHIKTA